MLPQLQQPWNVKVGFNFKERLAKSSKKSVHVCSHKFLSLFFFLLFPFGCRLSKLKKKAKFPTNHFSVWRGNTFVLNSSEKGVLPCWANSYPATRQGKMKEMGGERWEEQSSFSPWCPWQALHADVRMSGLNFFMSWVISHCMAGHCPPPQHLGWRLICNKPTLWQVVGTSLATHGCSLLYERTSVLRPSAEHCSEPPECGLLVPATLARGFTSRYSLAF